MNDRPTSGQGTRRVLLVVASVIIGSFVWYLLPDSDQLEAREAPRAASAATLPTSAPIGSIVARVGEIPITERELRIEVADEIAAIERRLLEEARERRIRELLLDAAAAARGTDRATLLAEEIDARLDSVPEAAVAAYRAAHAEAGLTEKEIRRRLRLDAFCAEIENRVEIVRSSLD